MISDKEGLLGEFLGLVQEVTLLMSTTRHLHSPKSLLDIETEREK